LTVAVQVSAEDRAELTRWTHTPSLRDGLARRARIVLLAGEGVGTNAIVRNVKGRRHAALHPATSA
jgi:hypothetical protein